LTVNADAHPLVSRFHRPGEEKRSLVPLAPEDCDTWLDAPPERAVKLLNPAADGALFAWADPAPVRSRR
jgi:putative SOS response-associated peptidase YedK